MTATAANVECRDVTLQTESGGHALSMSHPMEVNTFLIEKMKQRTANNVSDPSVAKRSETPGRPLALRNTRRPYGPGRG